MFKRKLTLIAALFAAGLFSAAPVQAGDTNTLTVSASVTGTCKFSSATSTLAFGALDPSSAAAATATGSANYWCTKGQVAAVTADNGANFSGGRRIKHATLAEFIPYTLTLTNDTATGAGPGSPVALGIGGSIANANYINASAGAYADTVTLTIAP